MTSYLSLRAKWFKVTHMRTDVCIVKKKRKLTFAVEYLSESCEKGVRLNYRLSTHN